MNCFYFKPEMDGFINHWLINGTKETLYNGVYESEDKLRLNSIDNNIISPNFDIEIGMPGPAAEPWSYYYPGQNIFVEKSYFYHFLTMLDLQAVTDIYAVESKCIHFRLWTTGTVDLWCNNTYQKRVQVAKYMRPEAVDVFLNLEKGRNRIYVRLQDIGIRDSRFLFGLQLVDMDEGLKIALFGNQMTIEEVANAESWLNGLHINNCGNIETDQASEIPAVVEVCNHSYNWSAGSKSFILNKENPFKAKVTMNVGNNKLFRNFEIAKNCNINKTSSLPVSEHRELYKKIISEVVNENHYYSKFIPTEYPRTLLRFFHDKATDEDKALLFDVLNHINSRPDCADFYLSTVLRLYMICDIDIDEKSLFKNVILNFRYWMDEDGRDGMCFWSENHTLLFRGCQMIAGQIFPDDIFTRSGRTGAKQAAIAQEAILKWLDTVEFRGFDEFLSNSYMPITLAALLNVIDFSTNRDISVRASALADNIFKQAALHSFDNVVASPQGRVYRDGVLYPFEHGTQAVLSYATPSAVVCYDSWLLFAATSSYSPPADIEDIMSSDVYKKYRQGAYDITIKKTKFYMLSSVAIPSQHTEGDITVTQGMQGYQQHLWNASLGCKCQVFVNHPGCTFDESKSRPGYWYGNGVFPVLFQSDNIVMSIYNIPDSEPVHFTHAHWPADEFDNQCIEENWAFGNKGDGYIAIWSDKLLIKHDDLIQERELRAYGDKSSWVCICSSADDDGDFSGFKNKCKELKPTYNKQDNKLSLTNGYQISW